MIYRDMSKYQNGKIYKIVDVGYNKCYIGSTCESLSLRMARHREKYKSYLKGKAENTRSFFLFDEFGVENCKIEWIEDYPCNTKQELLKQEGKHIRENECVNKIVSGRTQQEYRAENAEHLKNAKHAYHQNNREYRCFQKNIYDELNRDKVQERARDYYQGVKHRLFEKHICDCGKTYTLHHKRRHDKSQKHKDYLKQLEEQKEEK